MIGWLHKAFHFKDTVHYQCLACDWQMMLFAWTRPSHFDFKWKEEDTFPPYIDMNARFSTEKFNFTNVCVLIFKEPFDDALGVSAAAPPLVEQLQCESWFHGSLSRREAERLLTRDGDFLVRESGTTPGQYVLTGQQGGQPKHLLLVDPEGVVSQGGSRRS